MASVDADAEAEATFVGSPVTFATFVNPKAVSVGVGDDVDAASFWFVVGLATGLSVLLGTLVNPKGMSLLDWLLASVVELAADEVDNEADVSLALA